MSEEKENEIVHVRFGECEGGWAFDLGDGLYQIDNVPLDPNLKYKDIVKYPNNNTDKNPILVERTFPHTAGISYGPDTQEKYDEIKAAIAEDLKADNVCVEGVMAGRCLINYKGGFDPVAAFETLENVTVALEENWEDEDES